MCLRLVESIVSEDGRSWQCPVLFVSWDVLTCFVSSTVKFFAFDVDRDLLAAGQKPFYNMFVLFKFKFIDSRRQNTVSIRMSVACTKHTIDHRTRDLASISG